MSRTCRELRDRLTETGSLPADLEGHLESCPACAGFAERAGIARRIFRDHHAEVVPNASFAAAVVAKLEREGPATELGRAAARLIPATLALLAVLAWFAWNTEATPTTLVVESPVDSPISWVMEGAGDDS